MYSGCAAGSSTWEVEGVECVDSPPGLESISAAGSPGKITVVNDAINELYSKLVYERHGVRSSFETLTTENHRSQACVPGEHTDFLLVLLHEGM